MTSLAFKLGSYEHQAYLLHVLKQFQLLEMKSFGHTDYIHMYIYNTNSKEKGMA